MTHTFVARIAQCLLCIAAAASLVASGGTTNTWQQQADSVFASWNRPDSPGCALGVFQNGRIVFEKGYGSADLEHDIPITPDTVFYVGSLSKQFTAMAAALAIQQGRLASTDVIRKYLPELPDYADRITVAHLVHHTSGLRDYNTLLSIAGRRGDEAYDNATVLRITARQKKLNFEPGEEYLYSNTGYTLLATVVERAAGVPFAAFADRHIFTPLGMTSTHYHVDSGRLIKGRAYAYASGAGGAWRLETPSNERAGAGGVYTTVRDLLKWDENFYQPKVGDTALIERLQTAGKLNSGRVLDYAWGLQLSGYRGTSTVEHSGALGGYRAHLIRFPRHHTSVAALCNLGSITPGALVRQVADAVLGATLGESRKTPPPPLDPAPRNDRTSPSTPIERLDRFAGTYHSDEIDASFVVTAKDGQLFLRRETDAEPAPLQPSADGSFRFRGMTVRADQGPGDIVQALIVDAGRVRDIRFVRTFR